jgi:hypothetical protein
MPELVFVLLAVLVFVILKISLRFSKLTTDSNLLTLSEESGEDLAYIFHGGEHSLNTILLSLKNRRLLNVSKTRKKFKLNTSIVAAELSKNEQVIFDALLKIKGNRKGYEFYIDELYDVPLIRRALSSCFKNTKKRIFDLNLVATNNAREKKAFFKFLIISVLGGVTLLMLPFAVFWLLYLILAVSGLMLLNLVKIEQRGKGLIKQMNTLIKYENNKQTQLDQFQLIGVFGKKQFLKQW